MEAESPAPAISLSAPVRALRAHRCGTTATGAAAGCSTACLTGPTSRPIGG